MNTTFELIDQLYRSRLTILQILKDRDYNTKPYENVGPAEIESMLVARENTTANMKEKGGAFRIDVERLPMDSSSSDPKEQERLKKWGDSPIKKCRVVYTFTKLKSRLATFIGNLLNPDSDDYVNAADTEVIVILALPEGESVAESFHAESYRQWSTNRFRISFFRLANLVIHPSSHVLVPKHEFIAKSAVPFSPTERLKLPFIRFHEDMQARILGLVPGDVVKITRPSPASGEYTMYRICA
jgi:DNA-directed RNA polymerase subunit H (RpoH/RPB5)